MIDKTLQKLRMVGSTILAYNDFGIIYRSASGVNTLIKFTYNKSGTSILKSETIYGFTTFGLSKYFIQIWFSSGNNMAGLYVKTSRSNLVSRNKTIFTYFNSEGPSYLNEDERESPLLIYETITGLFNIVNYSGKRIDITDYIRRRTDLALGVLKLDNNRYRIGYGKAKVIGTGPRASTRVEQLLYWFIDVDIDFKDTRYNPNLADYYSDK